MKIKDYYYELQIRNRKELVYLSKIEAETLMLGLVENPTMKFVAISIRSGEGQVKIFINTSDIVSIIPEEGWEKNCSMLELEGNEEVIHKRYLEKVEKSKFLLPFNQG